MNYGYRMWFGSIEGHRNGMGKYRRYYYLAAGDWIGSLLHLAWRHWKMRDR